MKTLFKAYIQLVLVSLFILITAQTFVLAQEINNDLEIITNNVDNIESSSSLPLQNNTLYVNTSNKFYILNNYISYQTFIGPIEIYSVTDIAIHQSILYGITFSQFLIIDPTNGKWAIINNNYLYSLNEFEVDNNGNVYAASTSVDFVTINPITGHVTLIGDYGSLVSSSGDLALDSKGILYASVKSC